MLLVTALLPYLPGVGAIGFAPLSPGLWAAIVGIAGTYAVATEWQKARLHRWTRA